CQALDGTRGPPRKYSQITQALRIYCHFHWHDEEVIRVDLQSTFERWVFSFFFVWLCLSLMQVRSERENPGFARPQGSAGRVHLARSARPPYCLRDWEAPQHSERI